MSKQKSGTEKSIASTSTETRLQLYKIRYQSKLNKTKVKYCARIKLETNLKQRLKLNKYLKKGK